MSVKATHCVVSLRELAGDKDAFSINVRKLIPQEYC